MEPSKNRPDPRTVARRRAAAKRRRRQAALRRMCIVLALALVLIIVAAVAVSKLGNPAVVESYTMEAGSGLEPHVFLNRKTDKEVRFVTDLSKLNLKVPGEHTVEISVGDKTYTSTLVVRDTVAPTAQPVNTITKPGVLPKAEDLVMNIVDAGPVTVSYDQMPNVTAEGETVAVIKLTDTAGNFSKVQVPVVVFVDETPPVISGAKNREFFIGDSISYKEGITVTDDKTDAPILTVDNSAVKAQTPGIYPVIYTARDASGNETSVTVYFTFRERPSGYVEPEVAYQYARPIIDKIIKDDMTMPQKAAAIYNWVKQHISWYDHSDKTHGWPSGAVAGFEQRKGDCFTYYAVAKALLDVAGIPNLDVVKVVTPETSQSSHYWSLVDVGNGWYHMDCTPRANAYSDSFFLYTDAEMLAYSKKPANKNCFNFDLDAYPPRATESVQQYIKFSVPTVTIKESW